MLTKRTSIYALIVHFCVELVSQGTLEYCMKIALKFSLNALLTGFINNPVSTLFAGVANI